MSMKFFRIPKLYFEKFEVHFWKRNQKRILKGFFLVPNNYFKNVESKIINSITVPSKISKMGLIYRWAASIAILMMLWSSVYYSLENTVDFYIEERIVNQNTLEIFNLLDNEAVSLETDLGLLGLADEESIIEFYQTQNYLNQYNLIYFNYEE